MSAKHTPGPWRWLDSQTLVGDHGRRPVVLTARGGRGLQQRGEDGLLHALDCDDPNARIIAAAAEVLEALKRLVGTARSVRFSPGEGTQFVSEVSTHDLDGRGSASSRKPGARCWDLHRCRHPRTRGHPLRRRQRPLPRALHHGRMQGHRLRWAEEEREQDAMSQGHGHCGGCGAETDHDDHCCADCASQHDEAVRALERERICELLLTLGKTQQAKTTLAAAVGVIRSRAEEESTTP